MKFNYKWSKKDYPEKNGLKVFSTFACGGGSTMGYKLAGYDVIGCNEIDPKMMEVYKTNHNPKLSYLEDIRTFKNRDDLPEELYNLDILDGSPPCSSFSMAGNREKDWGKEKVFREGQAKQTLDDLFFDFIDLTKKLQPKVFIAENVKGILMGEATEYVKKIYKGFENAGYEIEHWLLDASYMGVPQKRQRVFFIGIRKDLTDKIDGPRQTLFSKMPCLNLCFDENRISILEFVTGKQKRETQNYSEDRYGDVMLDVNESSNTITTEINRYWLDNNTLLSDDDLISIGSFPEDYNFLDNNKQYLIGMSVPPIMTAQISLRIKEQWFDQLF